MSDRHRVFVSYYHDEDQYHKELFESLFSDIYDIYVFGIHQNGDIDDTQLSTERIRQIIWDEYLRDSTVTVVLIGAPTWQRKFFEGKEKEILNEKLFCFISTAAHRVQ